MKKIWILLLIVGMFVLTGCNNSKSSDTELQILGVNTKNIEKIEIIHGDVILYPDFEQKDNLTLIEDLNTVLKNTGDRLEALYDNLDIALVDAEAYAQNEKENYYVYMTFSDKQTLNFNNKNNKEHKNCDGVLLDMNNMRINCSRDGNFVGTMGYPNNPIIIEKEYLLFINKIKKIFAGLDN